MLVDVAIGHGYMPNGRFDPGAVNPNGVKEHDLATGVVTHLEVALRRSGVTDLYVEMDGGASHDPDYRGSTKRVNQEHAGLAIEIHFDSSNAPSGGFGIYSNDFSRAKDLANQIKNHWGQAGLTQRKSYADVRGLYFLHYTKCPSLIWECDHTDRHDPGTLEKMGEAIAAGICDYLRIPYIAKGREPAEPMPISNPPLTVHMVDAIAASACGVKDNQGAYILNQDGGIEAMHGAPFFGSFPGLPPGDRLGSHVFGTIRPRNGGKIGYICLDSESNGYEFGPGLNGFPA